ncbi:MAG: tetratricopeptide repeat protein [Cyanophyceae cyanobacterium]
MVARWMLGTALCLSLGAIAPGAEQAEAKAVSSAEANVSPANIDGILNSNSQTFDDGRYYSAHRFEGQAGQHVTITVTSQQFDPFLGLFDARDQLIASQSGADRVSLTVTLPDIGPYTVFVVASQAGETGRYTLSWREASATERELAEAYQLNQQVLALLEQGEYAQAIPLAERALAIRERVLGEEHADVATSVNNLASLYYDQGNYAKAEPLFRRALRISEEALGSNHPDVATSLDNLASLYQAQGNYAEAEPLSQRALAIRENNFGAEHLDVATSLSNLASLYQAQGRYAEAEPLLQRSLAISEKLLEPDHPDVTNKLSNLATLYQAQGNYAEAEPLLQRVLAIREKIFEPTHPAVANSLNNLAALYHEQGNYAEAASLFQRALAIREQVFGSEHPDVAVSLSNLATLYQAQGKYAEADPLFQRALAIAQEVLGPDHPDVSNKLNNLANLSQDRGNYSEAESLYQRALEIREQAFGLEHPDVAVSLNNLALLFKVQGNYAKAEQLYQQALKVLEQVLGPEHPDVATNLDNLAVLYQTQGSYSKAQPFYQRALKIREQAFGNAHPDVALSLNNLAGLSQIQENYARAETLHQRALKIREQVLGAEHPWVAASLNNLADLHQAQGDYVRAKTLHQRALGIFEQSLGAEHPWVAASLNNLAELHQGQGNYARAETLHQRALNISEQTFGSEHPDVALSLNNLSSLYQAQGNFNRALEFLTRGTDIEETNLALNLIAGSEAQKRAYLATFSESTDRAVSLHLQQIPDHLEAARLALTTLLRRKGRVLDVVANTLPSLRQRLDPEDQALLDELAAIRSQLAALTFEGAGTSPDLYREQLNTLKAEAERLEATLSRRSAAFSQNTQVVTIAAVQQQIPEEAALVELIRYDPFNAKAATPSKKWLPPRYAAYILYSQGDPRWVDLGEAAVIDRTVTEFRRSLANLPASPAASPALMKRATRQVKQQARRLDEQVMQPVRTLLGDTRTLLLAPDSHLNLIPFGALVDENDAYLVENYTITYLTSGRDLLRLTTTAEPQQPPVVVANPAYGAETLVVRPTERRSADLEQLSGCCLALAGTAAEAAAIVPLLPEVTVFTETAATKEALQKVNAPSILHIASHGFFLSAQEVKPQPTRGFGAESLAEPLVTGENPLLRSGLALAGFNPAQGKLSGALTALEVSGLDLWGTKLVVLSACSTGVGDVVDGEGVYGLRRALVIAGAESQLISLWNVADQGTKELMIAYYQRLLDGAGRSEALRQTQLALLESEQYSHPFYWAAFIPSGDWTDLESN